MTIIHMETDRVRDIGQRMNQVGMEMLSKESLLRLASGSLSVAWQGGGADSYHRELVSIVKKMELQIEELQHLSLRVSREVDEWSQVDQQRSEEISVITRSAVLPLTTGRLGEYPKVDGRTEYILIHGVESDSYAGYLSGDLTFDEAVKFIEKDPFKKELVDTSVTFYEAKTSGQVAFLDGRSGNFGGSLGSAEASGAAGVTFEKGTFLAGAEGEVGLYAAKGSYDADLAGFGIAAAGFLGGQTSGSAKLAFDPAQGEVGAKAEVDAFAGGKVEGSVSRKGEIAGVEGEATVRGGISYGVGVTAKADVGFSQGHIRTEIQLGATLGLGAEFGVSLDLNVQQAATQLVDTTRDALNWIF